VALLSVFGPICHPKTIENHFNAMICEEKLFLPISKIELESPHSHCQIID
jgi:hypothetical protein